MEHMELFIPSATAPRARRRSREVRHYDLPGMAILSHGIVLGKRITAFNCLYSAGRGHCRPDRDAGVLASPLWKRWLRRADACLLFCGELAPSSATTTGGHARDAPTEAEQRVACRSASATAQ